MPENYEPVVYTVSSAQPQAYDMQVFVIEKPREESSMEKWEKWRNNVESQDKYNTFRKIAEHEDGFFQVEEDRIEEYCKEAGFSRCRNIDKTCEEDGCHRVVVKCDDDSYNPRLDDFNECRKFDVNVEEDIDKELTEEEVD